MLFCFFVGFDICGFGIKKVYVIFIYKGKNLFIKKDIRCKVREFSKWEWKNSFFFLKLMRYDCKFIVILCIGGFCLR